MQDYKHETSFPVFQQKKRVSTWARRKIPISTPVAIATDAEHRKENISGQLPSAGVCWWVSDNCGSGIQITEGEIKLYTVLDTFISFVP